MLRSLKLAFTEGSNEMRIIAALMLAVVSMFVAQAGFAADTPCVCPELSVAQRVVGYLDAKFFLYGGGAIAVGIGICVLFGGILMEFADFLWAIVEEIADGVGYALSAGLILAGLWAPEAYQYGLVLVGCVLFAGSWFLMAYLREMKSENPRSTCFVFAVVWGLVAGFYGYQSVGVMAVAATMGFLGYGVGVGRLSYAFGFEKEEDMAPATFAAFIMITAFFLQTVYFPSAPAHVKVFGPGAFWLGSLVGFTGLLIMSNKWYVRDVGGNYGVMQILMLAACIGGIMAGATFAVQSLLTMSAAFFLLYVSAKLLTEITSKTAIGWGLKLILIGGLAMGSYTMLQKYDADIQAYITQKR